MLVYNYFPKKTGGAEAQCRLQAHELVRQGFRCVIITAKTQYSLAFMENDYGCEIVRIPVVQPMLDRMIAIKKAIFSWRAQGELLSAQSSGKTKAGEQVGSGAKAVQWCNTFSFIIGASFYLFIQRNSIDVLHTHVASWNAGFAAWIGNKLNIPVICKAAFLPAFHHFDKSIAFSECWKRWRTRTSFIALLPEMAEDISNQGVSADRIHVIPNGVSIPSETAKVEKNTIVLYVGNLTQGAAHKGFDVLISAWAKVCCKSPEAQLCIVGGGDKTPWVVMAKEFGCLDNISFTGHVTDIPPYYKQASIFVLPSRGEGISNALLEAQSYGVPAVVSDIPGNCEVVVDKETGLVVPVDDAVALSDAILTLIENPVVRQDMGKAARKNVVSKFSMASIVERVQIVYKLIENDCKK